MFANFLPKESVGSVFCFLCVMGAIGVFTPSTAQAGFDWTPPPAPAKAPSANAPAAPSVEGPLTPEPDALPVPVGPVETAPVSRHPAPLAEPLVVDNKAPVPTAEKIDEKPAPIEAETAITAPQPEPIVTPNPEPVAAPAPAPIPAQMPTPAPVAPTKSVTVPVAHDVVDGFGKDIPLAMALRDIVPAKYAYAFSPKDIAGTKISWRGGKPWQDVLKSALEPLDFDMQVNDTQILIYAKQYKAPTATPTPAATTQAPSAPPQSPEPIAPDDSDTIVVPQPKSAPTTTASADPLPLVDGQQSAQQQEMAVKSASPANDKALVASAMDLNATRKWQARPGTTLRQTLEAWSKDTNVELNWSTPYDYPINNAFYFDGKFTQAVDSLLSSYGGENPSPKGRLYPNLPEGPSVLMIN